MAQEPTAREHAAHQMPHRSTHELFEVPPMHRAPMAQWNHWPPWANCVRVASQTGLVVAHRTDQELSPRGPSLAGFGQGPILAAGLPLEL
jgi:hypothetical protein